MDAVGLVAMEIVAVGTQKRLSVVLHPPIVTAAPPPELTLVTTVWKICLYVYGEVTEPPPAWMFWNGSGAILSPSPCPSAAGSKGALR